MFDKCQPPSNFTRFENNTESFFRVGRHLPTESRTSDEQQGDSRRRASAFRSSLSYSELPLVTTDKSQKSFSRRTTTLQSKISNPLVGTNLWRKAIRLWSDWSGQWYLCALHRATETVRQQTRLSSLPWERRQMWTSTTSMEKKKTLVQLGKTLIPMSPTG